MKISIITVVYNSEKYISTAIKSVLSQTYSDIEYIVVDGNSSDSTVKIIKEYEPQFGGRMRWISEPDNGLYDAMNKGIRMATGDIVGILNSDDFLSSRDIVQIIVEQFKDSAIQAIYGDVRFVKSDDLSKTVRYYSSKIFSPKMFRWGFMPAHPSFYTYRQNFEKYGYYQVDYKIASDYELLIRFLYTHQLKSKYISKDFVTMRTGGESTKNLKSNLILNQEIVRGCRENGIYTSLPMLGLKYFYKVWELILKK